MTVNRAGTRPRNARSGQNQERKGPGVIKYKPVPARHSLLPDRYGRVGVANHETPYTIGEQLIKFGAQQMVEIVLGKVAERKISAISLSNSTIQRRITEMSENIKKQLVEEIQNAPFGLFFIQLDESTDVESCAQLLAFVRYVDNGNIEEEFLFRSALKTTTRASDILDKVSQFFETEKLSWVNLCSCCTDGAPSMLTSRSGFQARVKQLVPDVKGGHCMIHRQALAAKPFPKSFSAILNLSESQHYFPEVSESELSLVRKPFCCFDESVPDELQEEFIDLQNDSSAKDVYEDKTIEEFWPCLIHSYP
ncbi:protein FAM200C-like [Watersipora subatra]|uniref:protein FAM200C-like n=1 Tax=Watersipora subatra TaxID=2589382 RepID=UPI00355B3160